jgi:hypothetical protein
VIVRLREYQTALATNEMISNEKQAKVPPPTIDKRRGAVLGVVGRKAIFFTMPDGASGTPIFGLAICRYKDSGAVYRFSCNSGWETENDSAWEYDIQRVMKEAMAQYDIRRVRWIKYVSVEG